ncbi:hypothetical protein TUMSATVNIG2_16500 [Vibrio nigripulchritudo]|nr:hypothetical protein TUMSATVNIG2_16500 [Vibrio nigripulchritudo]
MPYIRYLKNCSSKIIDDSGCEKPPIIFPVTVIEPNGEVEFVRFSGFIDSMDVHSDSTLVKFTKVLGYNLSNYALKDWIYLPRNSAVIGCFYADEYKIILWDKEPKTVPYQDDFAARTRSDNVVSLSRYSTRT